ncbi:PaaI family thioesterase [Sphingomonas sp. BIUV-7]|uniref:PaaI family thioesterase n=1 Tax=Sphingomonas natans TaxID=3063330 RepID=A0ABT8YAY4_9SPHN|nr:PaaI family thioesterase [Sphingomonas sp. BIUV-7]MDO6415476.1 PaaI family thioesterase [Sphingomonas sp. BIUV-7]
MWAPVDGTRFNGILGKTIVRAESERIARVRMWPEHRHSNSLNVIHGGALLMLADVGLVAGVRALGGVPDGGVTIDLQMQFVSSGIIGQPLDLIVERVRETKRLLFARGTMEQDGGIVATTAGTFRKLTPAQ